MCPAPVSPAGPHDARLRGGAPHEAERRCGARDGGAGWVGPPATRRRLCVLLQIGDQLIPGLEQGLSHPLLKFSGGSGDDYATIPDDSSSPS